MVNISVPDWLYFHLVTVIIFAAGHGVEVFCGVCRVQWKTPRHT
jgi:hypothetical protein